VPLLIILYEPPARFHVDLLQERKSIGKQGLTVRRLAGSEVTAAQWDTFHSFYQATVDKKWGQAYLTREFWHM
jgi:predicted N-acyltransferase